MIKAKIIIKKQEEDSDEDIVDLRNQALNELNSDLTIGRVINIIEKIGQNEKRNARGYDWYQQWIKLTVYYEEKLETPIRILYDK